MMVIHARHIVSGRWNTFTRVVSRDVASMEDDAPVASPDANVAEAESILCLILGSFGGCTFTLHTTLLYSGMIQSYFFH